MKHEPHPAIVPVSSVTLMEARVYLRSCFDDGAREIARKLENAMNEHAERCREAQGLPPLNTEKQNGA